jgi:hypothetical protein
MNVQIFVLMLRATFLAVVLFTASYVHGQDSATERAFKERAKQLKELQEKRNSRVKQLKAMDIGQLARELEAESKKDIEPFNSMSFTEMVSRGEKAGSKLKPLLTQPDDKSLLGLLALRKVSPSQYQSLDPAFRVRVLTEALRVSKYFNKWGLPHLYWEDAAKAIIAEGKEAERPLIALLQNTRDAPMWGSDEVVEYKKYKYRVCDYAWALLNEIRGKKMEIPTDPAERDKLISEISK